ncbi:MAG: C10 family peptidase [Prevotella sp.]|nr:C10 family peptidase [Prevotella sp.]
MRRSIILFVTAMAFFTVHAEPVDKQKAFQEAVNFMQGINPTIQFTNNNVRKISGKTTSTTQPYYVFNAQENQGFVIVSGDDCTEPILGYAEKGSFDADNIPEALQFMLDRFAEQTQAMEEEGEIDDKAATSARKVVALPRQSITPFNPRRWSQNGPYNNMCPKDGDKRCSTGCLTTAIAILIGCFNWPEQTTTIPAYTTSTRGINMPELPPLTIDWEHMLDRYDGTYTIEEANAIARFMLYVAQGIKSDFTKDAVNAYISAAINALINYFDFDKGVHHIFADDYDTVNEFIDIVYDEIAHGRPVMLDGFSLSTWTLGSAGHAFICDGYEQNDMFHIDWGWMGYCNGYYRLTLLNPYKTTRNRNYTNKLGALVGVQPNGWKDNSGFKYEKEDMSLQLLSITPSNNEIRAALQNCYNEKLDFDNALALYDDSLHFIQFISSIDTTTFNRNGWNYKTYSSISFEGVADGTYNIIPISRINGEEEWHFDRCLGTYAYLQANVVNGQATYKAVETIVVNSFEVFEEDRGNGIGAPQTARLNVTNNSFDKFDKHYYLVANKSLNMINGLRIPMRSTVDIDFVFVPYVPGEYKLEICKDADGDFPIASTTTTASDNINYGNESKNYRIITAQILSDNTEDNNGTIGYVYTDKYKAIVKLTNIDDTQTFNDYVRFALSLNTSAVSAWESTDLVHVRLAPGESMTYTFESTEMSTYNTTYVFRVMTKWCTYSSMDNPVDWSKPGTYQIIATPYTIARGTGYRYWTTDGLKHGHAAMSDSEFVTPEDVVAISFDTPNKELWPQTFIPNSNPNTLYYFNGESNYPNLGNVINEGKAHAIHFVDGYPTFVPESFQVDSVDYIRSFDKGCEGKENIYNWSTIVLPFDVQRVTILPDSIDVDWFHHVDELQKDFWLCSYHGKENYTLLFDYSDEFLANTPYIIAVSNERIDGPGLVGKPISFCASDTEVKAGTLFIDTNDFDFEGNYTGETVSGCHVYLLGDEGIGNRFSYVGDTIAVTPFRAFVSSEVSPNSLNKQFAIKLLHENLEMTGIENTPISGTHAKDAIYDLSGRVLPSEKGNHKGIYIINGKKVILLNK